MACEPADAFYQKEISPNGPEVRLEEMRSDEPLFALPPARPPFLERELQINFQINLRLADQAETTPFVDTSASTDAKQGMKGLRLSSAGLYARNSQRPPSLKV